MNADIDVYLGSILAEQDFCVGLRIAFGNCCHKSMRDKVKFDKIIRGCPPYPFDLKKSLDQG